MKIIDEIEKAVSESFKMDRKSTFSGKLYGGVGLGCSTAALLLSLITSISFLCDLSFGVRVWLWTLYPTIILLFFGLFFSVKQRLRGRFMSANFSIGFAAISVLITLTLIIVQASLLGRVGIFPFVV